MFQNYITVVLVALRLVGAIYGLSTKEGPYKVVLYNTSSCAAEPPWFHLNTTVHTGGGRTLLRGTVVVKRQIKNIKFRIRLFHLKDGTKVQLFGLNQLDCRNTIIRPVLDMMGVEFNYQKCTMDPGSWEFGNLDVDTIIHSVAPSMWYGPMQVRWDIAAPTVQLMCLNINMEFIRSNK